MLHLQMHPVEEWAAQAVFHGSIHALPLLSRRFAPLTVVYQSYGSRSVQQCSAVMSCKENRINNAIYQTDNVFFLI